MNLDNIAKNQEKKSSDKQKNKNYILPIEFDTMEQAFEAAEKRRKQILKKSAITPERLYRQFTI